MTINKDLQREREKCTFDPQELTHWLDGSAKKTFQRRETGKCSIFTIKKTLSSYILNYSIYY